MSTLVRVTKVRSMAFLKAVILLILGGCSTGDDATTPSAGAERGPDLEVAVSSASAEPGKQVVIAVRPSSVSASFAGVQGRLRYDPARLRFTGQIPSGATFVVANWTTAGSGVVRALALNTRLESVAPALFVFNVLAPGYTPALRFETEAMVATGGNPVAPSRALPATIEDSSVANSATPRLLTVKEWAELFSDRRTRAGTAAHAIAHAAALEMSQAAIYGDANLDGIINILDALATANAAVGNVSLLTNPARDLAIAANVVPANLPGLGEDGDPVPPGRESDGTFLINILDAAVITNESIGNDPPIAGEPIPGRVPPSGRAVLSGLVAANRTLSRDTVYELDGMVSVANGATLTIPAGTRLEGRTSSRGALVLQLGGRILARGTRLQPIVMTCTAAVKTPGCWGGLTINGPSLLNNGDAGSGNEIQCPEKQAPAGAGTYGGCLTQFSSGVLRYVRVEYAGMAAPSSGPTPGLALLGVGSGTAVDSVQVTRSLAAGLFISGGRVNLRAIVLSGNADGGLHWNDGWQGKGQGIIVVQHPGNGPAISGSNATGIPNAGPRSLPQLFNVTLVGPGSGIGDEPGILLHDGSGARIGNAVITAATGPGIDIQDSATCALSPDSLQVTTTVFGNNLADFAMDVDCVDEGAFVTDPSRSNRFVSPGLLAPLATPLPDLRPAAASAAAAEAAPPADGFFDPLAMYNGAVPPARLPAGNIPWYAGWTDAW